MHRRKQRTDAALIAKRSILMRRAPPGPLAWRAPLAAGRIGTRPSGGTRPNANEIGAEIGRSADRDQAPGGGTRPTGRCSRAA